MLFLYFMTTNGFCCFPIPNDESDLLLHMQTINDVLFGIISAGLFRYLDHRSPNGNRGVAFPAIPSIFVDSKTPNLDRLKCSFAFVSGAGRDSTNGSGDG